MVMAFRDGHVVKKVMVSSEHGASMVEGD